MLNLFLDLLQYNQHKQVLITEDQKATKNKSSTNQVIHAHFPDYAAELTAYKPRKENKYRNVV